MPRWVAVVRGIGLLVAVPAAVMGLLMLTNDVVHHIASPDWLDVATSVTASAALLLVVASLLVRPVDGSRISRALYVISTLLAPLAAFIFYVGSLDPAILFLGAPLVLPPLTVMLLSRRSCCPWGRGGAPAV